MPKHQTETKTQDWSSTEEWQNETTPFCTIRTDHKEPLHQPNDRNLQCLLVIDAFFCFLMVYPVTKTGAQATFSVVEKWIPSFGIPLSIVHDRGSAIINSEFVNWTKELGITLRPRTAHSPWTNGKIETQNQHIARCWRNFLNDAGNNWSSSAPKFAFAHNTSVNHTTVETPYEIVFGTKPQIPMSLELGLYRNKHKFCCSIHTAKTTWRISYKTVFFDHNFHTRSRNDNATPKESILLLSKDVESKQLDRMPTEVDLNWDST